MAAAAAIATKQPRKGVADIFSHAFFISLYQVFIWFLLSSLFIPGFASVKPFVRAMSKGEVRQ
jgi:hypothetical protein